MINKFSSVLLKNSLFFFLIESDESPGMYLRDDFLGGPTELRAPTAERAALFLDAALAGRTSSIYEPALIFTLHVYQYSLAGKGGGELCKLNENAFNMNLN
jgi:kinesin family member 26